MPQKVESSYLSLLFAIGVAQDLALRREMDIETRLLDRSGRQPIRRTLVVEIANGLWDASGFEILLADMVEGAGFGLLHVCYGQALHPASAIYWESV